MDLDFDDFQRQNQRWAEQLEQGFQTEKQPVQQEQFEWDNFGDAEQTHSSIEKSQFSPRNQSPVPQSNPFEREDSRMISEISFKNCPSGKSIEKSFRFERNDSREQIEEQDVSRFQRLKNFMDSNKDMGMSAFYRKLDQMNQYAMQDEPFESYQAFKAYAFQLKKEKRRRQVQSTLKTNPFSQFSEQKIETYEPFFQVKASEQNAKQIHNEGNEMNFFNTLKSNKSEDKGSKNVFTFRINQNNKNQIKENEITHKTSMQETQKQLSKQQSSQQDKKKHLEQKFEQIINGYSYIKQNYGKLRQYIKKSEQNKKTIIQEIKELKEQKKRYKEQRRKERESRKNKAIEVKKQKLNEIKNKLQSVQSNKPDILFLETNEKIARLQNALFNVYDEVNKKSGSPRVIHYFSESGSEQTELSSIKLTESQEKTEQESNYVHWNNFTSPFEMRNSIREVQKIPHFADYKNLAYVSNNAEVYIPKGYEESHPSPLRSLTRKQSITYQTNQITIQATFRITKDPMQPLKISFKLTPTIWQVNELFLFPYFPTTLIFEPKKIHFSTLRSNQECFFECFVGKDSLELNSIYFRVFYRPDSPNACTKKLNCQVIFPIFQLLKVQYVEEEQFAPAWQLLPNQMYTASATLSHPQQLHMRIKKLLPFTHLLTKTGEQFALLFRYPTFSEYFMVVLQLLPENKALLRLKSSNINCKLIKQQLLQAFHYYFFQAH